MANINNYATNVRFKRIGTFTKSITVLLFVFVCLSMSYGYSQQQTFTAPSSTYECTQVSIDDIDPNLLTKQERIQLLEGSLNKSIDNFSTCVNTVQQQSGASNGAGGGGGAGSGNEGDANASGSSNAQDTELQGEEQIEGQQTNTSNSPEAEPSASKNITPKQREVVAPKDNDKIICKLLFQEISSVTDPDMLEGLKEQYKNYNCG